MEPFQIPPIRPAPFPQCRLCLLTTGLNPSSRLCWLSCGPWYQLSLLETLNALKPLPLLLTSLTIRYFLHPLKCWIWWALTEESILLFFSRFCYKKPFFRCSSPRWVSFPFSLVRTYHCTVFQGHVTFDVVTVEKVPTSFRTNVIGSFLPVGASLLQLLPFLHCIKTWPR